MYSSTVLFTKKKSTLIKKKSENQTTRTVYTCKLLLSFYDKREREESLAVKRSYVFSLKLADDLSVAMNEYFRNTMTEVSNLWSTYIYVCLYVLSYSLICSSENKCYAMELSNLLSLHIQISKT